MQCNRQEEVGNTQFRYKGELKCAKSLMFGYHNTGTPVISALLVQNTLTSFVLDFEYFQRFRK